MDGRRDDPIDVITEADVYYEKESNALNFLAGLAIGAVLGASVALLTAPQSGKRTRRQIVRVVSDTGERARGHWDEIGGQQRRYRRGRRRVRRR